MGIKKTTKDSNAGISFVSPTGDRFDLIFSKNTNIDLYINNLYKTTLADKTTILSEIADEEDLIVKADKLQLKDRVYSENTYTGYGKKILRKNIVASKNILLPSEVMLPNTIYEIRYDFDLNDGILLVPENSILNFDGGSFSNGKVVLCGNCFLQYNRYNIFNNITIEAVSPGYIFNNKGIDLLFNCDDNTTLSNLAYFKEAEITKNYNITTSLGTPVLVIYDRSYVFEGNGRIITFSGTSNAFISTESTIQNNIGNKLIIKNVTLNCIYNGANINYSNYPEYSSIAVPYGQDLLLDNVIINNVGVAITAYGTEDFENRNNKIVLKNSILRSNYFVIEDTPAQMVIDNSLLSAYDAYMFDSIVISNGYEIPCNVYITNSTIEGCIEARQGTVIITGSSLFEKFNVAKHGESTIVENLDVSISNCKFTIKNPNITPGYWNCCNSIKIDSCEFLNTLSAYESVLTVGVCNSVFISNCVFSPTNPDSLLIGFLITFLSIDLLSSIIFTNNIIVIPEKLQLRTRVFFYSAVVGNVIDYIISKIVAVNNNIFNASNYTHVLQYAYGNDVFEKYEYNHYIFDSENSFGTTAQRPLFITNKPKIGYKYFDTTLEKPIYRSESAWVE